jgi:hypothetical protein
VRRRRRNRGPQHYRRISLFLSAAGAGLAAAAGYFHATAPAGSSRAWIFLLLTVGLALAVSAAALETRAADLLADFDSVGVRRRGTLLLVAGMCAFLVGCVSASLADEDALGGVGRAISMGVLVLGIASGLSGSGVPSLGLRGAIRWRTNPASRRRGLVTAHPGSRRIGS